MRLPSPLQEGGSSLSSMKRGQSLKGQSPTLRYTGTVPKGTVPDVAVHGDCPLGDCPQQRHLSKALSRHFPKKRGQLPCIFVP